MLSHLRKYVGPIKRLLAWPFLKAGVGPTAVGIFGVVLALMAAILARMELYSPAFYLAVAAVLTDMADGEVARATGETTPIGNYYDAIGDRTRECILLFGLLPTAPNLVALGIIGTCMTSFAKARCSLVRVMDNRDWPGFGDHPDRAVIIAVAYLFQPVTTLPLLLLVLATWGCFLSRVRYARDLIVQAEPEDLMPYLRPVNPSQDQGSAD